MAKRKKFGMNKYQRKAHTFRGRCDWCGESDIPVSYDHETEFETYGSKRFALVCAACETV